MGPQTTTATHIKRTMRSYPEYLVVTTHSNVKMDLDEVLKVDNVNILYLYKGFKFLKCSQVTYYSLLICTVAFNFYISISEAV